MSTEERERQLVRGVITGIEVKGNESFQIVVTPDGSQYAKKLWTKEPGLVQQIQAGGIGQRFDFMCSVSHWAMADGKQVRSLWLDTIAEYNTLADPAPTAAAALPGASLPGVSPAQAPAAGGLPMAAAPVPQPVMPTAAATIPMGTPAPAALPPEVKELRIMRQTAMKCATAMVEHLPADQRGFEGLEHMAERFLHYFQGGPGQGTSSNGPAAPPVPDEAPWTDEQQPETATYTGGFPS